MDCSATLLAKSFDLFQVRSSDNNLSLWHLDDASIEVFEEEAALFKCILVYLEDLNEVDVTTIAKLVLHSSQLTKNDILLLACTFNHPLKIFK